MRGEKKYLKKYFVKEHPLVHSTRLKYLAPSAECRDRHPGGPEADAAAAGSAGSPRYSATRPSAPASASPSASAQAATRAAAPDASSTADTASHRLRGLEAPEDGDDAGLRLPAWPRLDGGLGVLGRGRDLDRERARSRGRLGWTSSSEDAVVVVVDGNGSVSWASLANLNKSSQKMTIIFGVGKLFSLSVVCGPFFLR